ncbi:MAG: glutamate racemase [Oscillospiraceae bacterium]|jgi:glutamate racemase|nr:glutamate racemase [Oscillospiraceae bacterium]
MDKRPIGVFDSGLGGLTVVKKLAKLLPEEDIIYLGDTGRVPYGSRSHETIIKYAQQDAAFLTEFDIKAMVIACNTVCSVAFRNLEAMYDIPIYEVVSAPVRAAAESTKNGRIGVIGTSATIQSCAYEKSLINLMPEATVFSTKCPLFVPLVEEGWIHAVDEAALVVAERYLDNLCESEIDTLILGCTHYPLLNDVISKIMGPDVILIDSGAETVKYVADDLKKRDILTDSQVSGNIKYFVTDSVENFEKLAAGFLESDVQGLVKQVTLE